MWFHKLISTCLGIGYINKGAGTVAAGFCCICWYLLFSAGYKPVSIITLTIGITALGVWTSGRVESIWGKDHNRVVIDEVAGMCISLLFLPVKAWCIVVGFLLFRFFDIVKPLYIRRVELWHGGWGVMFDDVLAGCYTNLLLQLVTRVFFFRQFTS